MCDPSGLRPRRLLLSLLLRGLAGVFVFPFVDVHGLMVSAFTVLLFLHFVHGVYVSDFEYTFSTVSLAIPHAGVRRQRIHSYRVVRRPWGSQKRNETTSEGRLPKRTAKLRISSM